MADFGVLDLEKGSSDTEVNNSRCLVGKVVHDKNLRAPILANILGAAWRTRAPFHVDEWNNIVFIFRYENEEDRSSILQEAPWSVMGNLLVLIPLRDGMVVSELNFNFFPFWIQIHGLPVEKLSRANAEIIGNRVGKLLALETAPDGFCLTRGYLRVQVEINIEHPLPKGFWSKGKTKSSPNRWVSFKFEKLPDFCYACGRLGHDNRACRFVSKADREVSGYGLELRTGRAKKCATSIEIIRAEVDAAELRVNNLLLRRSVIQINEHGTRVINQRAEQVIPAECTMEHQRKSEDEAPSLTRSKLLRLCSPPAENESSAPNRSSSRLSGKTKKIMPRARANSKSSTFSKAQDFKEDELCEVRIQQWAEGKDELNSTPLIGFDQGTVTSKDLELVLAGNYGRVIGPEQPNSLC
ncbi:hypothetical protein Vadar_008609 [Vaccinium darrowii]|nr:hypothetical protein Vadar_008609 [Vaccinium darrowii]